jgi:hypothetical protein
VPVLGQKPQQVPIMHLSFVNGHVIIEPAKPDMPLPMLRLVAAGALAELDRQIMINSMAAVIQAHASIKTNGSEPKGGLA